MHAFATIDDYTRRYGEVDNVELLLETLTDASRKIAAKLDLHGIDYIDPDDDYAERLMQVCRDMAHRAVTSATSATQIPFGATQFTTTADGFSEQVGFQGGETSGYGELYMTKSERELLGITRQRISSLYPEPLRRRCHARC